MRPGINGFVARTVAEAVDAVARISELDRRTVRADCEARFGNGVIVDAYEQLYLDMIART